MGRSITPIPFPLSKGQAGIWLAHHMAPGCTFYTIAQYTDLDGPIDVAVFEGAARQVIAETETLRLRFAETPDGPVQWIEAGLAADWTLPVHDLSGEADPEPAARRLTRTLLGQPFDLTSDAPLFRWHLIRTGTRRWIWFQAYHHIVLDGLGLALVKARLAEVYSASLRNEPARGQAFVPLRELLGSPGYGPGTTAWEEDRAHWLALLAGQPETVSLAGGGVGWERDFRRETCVVPQGITDALATLGKSLGATLPAMLAAAVAIYVGRLAGRSETLLGWQVTGRFDAAARRAPAMLSNTVPLRLATAPGDRLAGVVRDAAQQTRSALGHQRYAHETLRRDLGLEPIAADMFGTLVNVSSVERASLFGTTQGLTYNLSNGPVLAAAGTDRRAVRHKWQRAAVPHRRPGALAPRRHARFSRPVRRSGQNPRVPGRAGRGRGVAAVPPRPRPGQRAAARNRRRDQACGLLAIIDTRWPGWRPSGPALLPTAAAWARNLPLWLYDEGRNFDGRQMRRRIGRKASRLSAIMRKKPLRPGMILDLDRVAPDAHGLLDRQLAAARAYSPRPTQLPIALFQAAVQPISKPCGDPAFGWRAVADASFASYRVPGNHFTMLAQPYVQHLAQAIDAALRRRE